MIGEKFYTLNEAARALSISRSSLYLIIGRGEIAVTRFSPRTSRIAESELSAFIASRVQRMTREPPSNKRPAASQPAC